MNVGQVADNVPGGQKTKKSGFFPSARNAIMTRLTRFQYTLRTAFVVMTGISLVLSVLVSLAHSGETAFAALAVLGAAVTVYYKNCGFGFGVLILWLGGVVVFRVGAPSEEASGVLLAVRAMWEVLGFPLSVAYGMIVCGLRACVAKAVAQVSRKQRALPTETEARTD